MTHTWPAEHVLIAYTSTQWLKVIDTLPELTWKTLLCCWMVKDNTDMCHLWLSSSARIFLVPSMCFPWGNCQPKHIWFKLSRLYFKTGVDIASSRSFFLTGYYFQSSQGLLFCVAWCSMFENCCFIYFIQVFSSSGERVNPIPVISSSQKPWNYILLFN